MSAAFEKVGSSIWFEANGVDLGRVWLIRQFLAIYLYLALTVTDTLERSNRPTDTRRYIGRPCNTVKFVLAKAVTPPVHKHSTDYE